MSDTKTTKTIAEELREAAKTLREVAKEATRGPWVPYPTITADQHAEAWTIDRPWCDQEPHEPDCGHTVLKTGAEGCEEDYVSKGDAAWICLANPLLAEPLASWLEEAAKDFDEQVIAEQPECPACGDGCYADHGTVLVHDGGCADVLDVGEVRCRCFDGALAVARVLNGTAT